MNLLYRVTLIFFITSCSNLSTHQNNKRSASNKSELRKKTSVENNESKDNQSTDSAPKVMSDKLDQLIKAAKESGQYAVDYLANDIFLKANAASIHGDWNTAQILYSYLIRLVPEDPYAKKKLAESQIRVGHLDEAKKQLEELYKNSHEKNERVGLILAGVYNALLEKENARSLYKKLLKNDPKNVDACIFLGKSYTQDEQAEKISEGLTILANCEKKNPKEGLYSFYMAKINLEKGKNEEALRHFKRALKLDPEDEKSALAVGVLLEEKGKTEEAIKTYKDFLNENPSDVLILNKIVEVLFSLSKSEEIVPYLTKLINIDPENLNLKAKLGILLSDLEKYEEAKEVFEDLLVHVPTSDKVIYYLGAIYQETGDHNKAIEYYSRIPSDSSLFYGSNLQIAQLLMADVFKADQQHSLIKEKVFFDYIDEKVKKYPEIKVQFFVLKASYLENKTDFAKAITVLEEVKKEKEFSSNHLYFLGSIYEKMGNHDEAYSIIMKIISDDPKNAHAWNFIGYSLLERGKDLDKAFEYIQKAVALRPEDGFIRDSLGWFYFKTGKLNLALKEMQKAVKSVTNDMVITKHLAMVYQSLNQLEMAKKYYGEALKYAEIESERVALLKAMDELSQSRLPASEIKKTSKNKK